MDWMHQPHSPLILSMLALIVGPLVYQLARVASGALAALDGFVYVAIGGLVLFHIVPDSISMAGWSAAAGGLVGLLAPSLVEHRLHGRARHAHAIAIVLGVVAIGLHAFTDGLALVTSNTATSADGESHMLPMAVVLHRLPIGLTIWFLLRPAHGWRIALAALVLIAVATGAGFTVGEALTSLLESQGRAVFQAFVAGSLLHVIVHRSYPITGTDSSPRPSVRWYGGLGALGGVALVWGMSDAQGAAGVASAAAGQFVTLTLQSAPALLLAYVMAGLVYGLLPEASARWMGRGSSLSQALRGMGFGLPLPICSCGVVPVYQSLVVGGVPATAAMAFLIATPELDLAAVLISIPLLGGEFTAARVACAAAVALAVGWGLGRLVPPQAVPRSAGIVANGDRKPLILRIGDGLRVGLGEVVDTTAPWILAGLALAALVHPLLDRSWIDLFPDGFGQIEFFALLGIPAYVCATGATPIVAALVYKGVSPGAALAFLLTGPATNVTTFGVLSRLHGRRIALAFGASIAVSAVLLGHLVDVLVPSMNTSTLEPSHPEGIGLSEVSLFLLIALFVQSLVRQGPRQFVGEIFNLAGDSHEHEDESDDVSGSCCECGDDAAAANALQVPADAADDDPAHTIAEAMNPEAGGGRSNR